MPQIPLYQSQTLPQGIISASPSTSGRLAGESLRGVASTVSALSATATRAVQMENEKEAQDARVAEERRMQDLRDEGQLLAMSKASVWWRWKEISRPTGSCSVRARKMLIASGSRKDVSR